MVFGKSKKINKEETPIVEEDVVEESGLGELPELNLPENLGNIESSEEVGESTEIVPEEVIEELEKEVSKEEPKKEITINDLIINHENRLVKIESAIYRLGGI